MKKLIVILTTLFAFVAISAFAEEPTQTNSEAPVTTQQKHHKMKHHKKDKAEKHEKMENSAPTQGN